MIILPDVDLSTAMVGSSGTILLQNMGVGGGGVSANPTVIKNLPTLFMHNESGCGLSIILKDSQKSFNIAAGQWVPIAIGPGESAVIWKVKYILPNAPVNLLMTTYYFPGEPIPNIAVLGNSPIGIGGSTNNTVVSTLSNEANAANTLVVDIGNVTITQLIKMWTDHFAFSVMQSNIAHTVLQGNTTGNPLQLGQAGDITEILGQLVVDQATTITGILTCLSQVINTINSAAGSGLTLNVPTGHTHRIQVNGGDVLTVDSGGPTLASGTLSFLVGTISRIARFGAAVTTTPTFFNHNLGTTPDLILLQPTGAASVTRSCVYDDTTMTTTQVKLTGNGSFSLQGLSLAF